MIIGAAGVPQDLAVSRDYDAIFSQLRASGVTVYTPTSQYQENPVALTLGLESDFLPPPYGTADPSVYEAMRAHGITLVISADQLYNPKESMPAPENDPLLALINAAGRDVIHAIYAYDEPAHQGVSIAASQALYEHIKAFDPTLPVIQIHRNLDETNPEHLTPEGMATYLALVKAHAQWADIVGFDIYPIGLSRGAVTPYSNGEMVPPAQAVRDYMTWLQMELPDSQHALVLQAFNVLDLYSDDILATLAPEVIAALTPPTAEELASMLAAAHEADEIFWWGQSHISDAATSQLWQNVLAQTASFLVGFSDNDIVGTEAAETLTGTESAERISGAGGDDILFGGGGDDTLVGGMGADEMIGMGGSDIYYVDNVSDTVDENGGNGVDVIRTNLTVFDLNAATVQGDIENLVGTLATGQVLTGNALDNVITGSWGNDTLSGGGGGDTLVGGAGDDTYVIDAAGVTIVESADSGNDTVLTSLVEFSLTAGIAIENLTGQLASGQHLTGNALDNVIVGGIGNDFLVGGGGLDILKGGLGNDIYVLSETEVANETGGAGSDEVQTDLSGFDLRGSSILGDIEDLTGTSDGGQFLIGNTLDNTILAGAGNDTLDGDGGADTLQGGLGDDLYIIDQSNDFIRENLSAGTDSVFSTASYVLSDNVERVLLSGSAAINATGNATDNYIQGNAAANILDGNAGVDTMLGGDGNDIFIVDNVADLAGETNANAATGGTDTVYSYASYYTLSANIENGRILTANTSNLIGNSLNNLLFAGAGNNTLFGADGRDTASYAYAGGAVTVSLALSTAQATGSSGSDTLIGFENLLGSAFHDTLAGNSGVNELNGGAGADRMSGGDGNDTYHVDDAGDLILESNSALSTGGSDLVQSYISSYTLTANVENGRVMVAGEATLNGNTLNNSLYAGVGNNILNGASGIDTANYSYATSAVSVSLSLNGYQVTGGSGSDSLISIEYLVGSSFNDNLTGNSSTNVLNGGSGADRMSGGDGNDMYYVDNIGDLVVETNAAAAGGVDILYSYVAHCTLGANVENGRILTANPANMTGNLLNNVLYAGAGNNTLDGADGTDTVSYAYASGGVSINLAVTGYQLTGFSGSDALVNIESVTGSNFNDTLIGSGTRNGLNGGNGNDSLNGGSGIDTLTGGAGADVFVFNSALGPTNLDTIVGYSAVEDSIHLENTGVFSSLGLGALNVGAFNIGASATQADDRIIYNSATGALLYDADGNGSIAAVQFATITGLAGSISASDFFIF